MNIIERFLDHQIGYVYQTAATQIDDHKAELVPLLTPLIGQGASALTGVVNQFFGHEGATGLVIERILDDAISTLDAETLALLSGGNVSGFLDAVVAKLQAHATKMLAA